MIFNMTGGGNPLNFHVKTYPSETELKADNPKENTIGVITTTTMTSWAFLVTEPKKPEVGMVWFGVGDFSSVEFNALVKNTLQVYPRSAKQYVSNEWKDIPVLSYDGEAWVAWKSSISILTLFEKFTEARENGEGEITVENDVISFSTTSSSYNYQGNVTYYSDVKVDVSNYKTLTFEATVSGEPIYAKVGFFTDNTIVYPWGTHGIGGVELENGTKTYTVDISAIGNTTYFGVGAAGGDSVKTINVEVRNLYLT